MSTTDVRAMLPREKGQASAILRFRTAYMSVTPHKIESSQDSDLARLTISPDKRRSSAEAGKRRRRVVGWVAFLLAVMSAAGVLLWSGYLSPAVEVEAFKVSQMFVSRALNILKASGYVVAQRKAAVASKATGRIAELFAEEGKFLKKGEVIARLENDDLQAALEEAEANLKVARSGLKNAEAELHEATRNYNRRKSLRKKEAVSEQALDAAEARYRKARAIETSARFRVDSAAAAVKVAQVNLAYSFIRAPFDGVILTKNADEGEVVAPFGSALNAKAAVATMADMSSLMVEVDVAESNLEKVKQNGPCEIRLDALPNDRFVGTVHMIVPTADRTKATVLTKVKFDSYDRRVLPEMSAKVAFLSRPLKDSEKAPILGVVRSALRGPPGDQFAFLIEGARVRAVPVKIGRSWGDTVEIVEGLKENDLIVLNPGDGLQTGTRVMVKE